MFCLLSFLSFKNTGAYVYCSPSRRSEPFINRDPHSFVSIVVVVVVLVGIVPIVVVVMVVRLALQSRRGKPLVWQRRLLVVVRSGTRLLLRQRLLLWHQWNRRRRRHRQGRCRVGVGGIGGGVGGFFRNLLVQCWSTWRQILLSPLDTRVLHVHHVVFLQGEGEGGELLKSDLFGGRLQRALSHETLNLTDSWAIFVLFWTK